MRCRPQCAVLALVSILLPVAAAHAAGPYYARGDFYAGPGAIWDYDAGNQLLDDGLHGDGAAGDGVYGADVISDQAGGFHEFKIANADWTQFQHDAAHTGFNPFENTLTTANAATLVPAWTFTGNQPGRVSPTVAKGIVYFSDIDPLLPSTADVYAVNASTGNVKWERKITFGDLGSCPAPVDAGIGGSSAAVAGTTVYVGFSDRYCVMAFNASTGATKWVAADVGGRGFHSSLTISGNTVYALGDNHVLYARATTNGSLRWSRAINGQGISQEDSVPAVATVMVAGHAKTLVFVGSADFNLYVPADATLLAWICALSSSSPLLSKEGWLRRQKNAPVP